MTINNAFVDSKSSLSSYSSSSSSSPDSRSPSPPDDSTNGRTKVQQAHSYKSRSSTAHSSRRSYPSTILGSIDENGGMKPDIPIRSTLRPMGHPFISFFPSKSSLKSSETQYDDVTGPRGEKFDDMRRNIKGAGHPKRGGWRTFLCLGFVAFMILAGLIIGLAVGLTKRKGHSSDTSSGSNLLTANGTALTGFPVGSYTISTYLSSLSTNCTSNAATWRCYPYQTYSQSATGSEMTLNWNIAGYNDTNGSAVYTISSSQNVFAIAFTNASLTLQNKDTQNEAWVFNITTPKVVIPTESITDDGSSSECFYHEADFAAFLYTRKPKTYPTNAVNDSWPYAVEIIQAANAGDHVPDCYKTFNGNMGDPINIVPVPLHTGTGQYCNCLYLDFDT